MTTNLTERNVSTLFSAPLFRPFIQRGTNRILDQTVADFRKWFGLPSGSTNLEVLIEAFKVMSHLYRSEYFYKNLLANRYYVGRYKDGNAVLINEFRIGDAVADCVLINGQGVAYEIKTEFDSPNKLNRQIENYYKAFPYMYVVTHEKSVDKYAPSLEGSPVGLLAVTIDGRISTVKMAQHDDSQFDTRTIFNLLRKKEIANILEDWHGSIPRVPNGILYNTYLELAKAVPPREFQSMMQQTLKNRTLKVGNQKLANLMPFPLQSLIIQLNPTPAQFEDLMSWLNELGE